MKKVFFYLAMACFVLTILPFPLGLWVDPVYSWMLIITIPGGIVLGGAFLIIWAIIKDREKKRMQSLK